MLGCSAIFKLACDNGPTWQKAFMDLEFATG